MREANSSAFSASSSVTYTNGLKQWILFRLEMSTHDSPSGVLTLQLDVVYKIQAITLHCQLFKGHHVYLLCEWERKNPSWIKTCHTWKDSNRFGTEEIQWRRKHSHPNQWISKKANLLITLFIEKQLLKTTVFVCLKLLRLIVTRLSDGRSNGWMNDRWFYPSVWILSQIGRRLFLLLQSSVLSAHHSLRHRWE